MRSALDIFASTKEKQYHAMASLGVEGESGGRTAPGDTIQGVTP